MFDVEPAVPRCILLVVAKHIGNRRIFCMEIADQRGIRCELLLRQILHSAYPADVLNADAAPVVADDMPCHCRLRQKSENRPVAVNEKVRCIVHRPVLCRRSVEMPICGLPRVARRPMNDNRLRYNRIHRHAIVKCSVFPCEFCPLLRVHNGLIHHRRRFLCA